MPIFILIIKTLFFLFKIILSFGGTKIVIENIKKMIQHIGFNLKNGEKGVWYKYYPKLDNYEITIFLDEKDLSLSKINYGNK